MTGPRTKEKDNSHQFIKIALRKWAIDNLKPELIFDVYGGYGLMYNKVWKDFKYDCAEGDALKYLENISGLNHDIFDVDPYSSPYEALQIIANKASKKIIGVICTDGCLKRQCHMRGNLPKFIQIITGWPQKDNSLMAAIYYNYPSYLRFLLKKLMPGWDLLKLVVKPGIGFGKADTVYWAGLFRKT